MNDDTSSLGARLERLRREHGMSRDDFASRAALKGHQVSAGTVKAIERGKRFPSHQMLLALAETLDVAPSELADRKPRLTGGHDTSVLAIRDAIQSPASIGALPEGTAAPLDAAQVRQGVADGYAAYWAGHFTRLTAMLPDLITSARAAREQEGPAMAEPLALAGDLAAALLVHLGKEDLALVAAERALSAAAGGEDELFRARVRGSAAWVMLHQGRQGDAERVAVAAAGAARQVRYGDTDLRDAAYGSLLLTAVGAAAAGGADVAGYLAEAERVAEGLGRPVRVWQTTFGLASVRMQAVYAYAVSRQPGRALREARRPGLRLDELAGPVSAARHLLDIAQAHVDAGHYGEATGVLAQARRTGGAVWFRHQGVARLLVGELLERKARLTAPLRDLAADTGADTGHAPYYRPGGLGAGAARVT